MQSHQALADVSHRNRLRRFSSVLRTPLGATSVFLLVSIVLLAVVAHLIWAERAGAINPAMMSQGSSPEHPLGTDSLGRDILSRVLVATRLTIQNALLATAIGVVVGLMLGSTPSLLGRRWGRLATAGVNITIAFPYLLLALFFAVTFGAGPTGAILAVGLAFSPWYARLTQTLISSVQERDFVAAARIAGVGRVRVLIKHVLPNIGEPLIINATVGAGHALLAFAGLSFLGLGVQLPNYDWGVLLHEGLNAIYVRPAAALAPGAAIILTGLAFNLAGEAFAKQLAGRTSRVQVGSGYTTSEADESSHSRLPAATVATSPAGAEQGRPTIPDDEVLALGDLVVRVPGTDGLHDAVRGISFSIARGEAVGIVGESGSGKSLTALAVTRLLEPPLEVTAGRLRFLGADLTADLDARTSRLLGTKLGVVFQDPASSLNPTMRIGTQLAEATKKHQGLSRRDGLARVVERLRSVHVPAAERRVHDYPHQFSGGMRQRAMIAMAMMGGPALIVADEPTTALDVTVQKRVLLLLDEQRRSHGVALLLISHDIAVVSQVCDRVLVMYGGKIVEELPTSSLRAYARHPYTRLLIASIPDMDTPRDTPLATISGRPVDPSAFSPGCSFAARCPLADDRCRRDEPVLVSLDSGHRVACWHHDSELPVENESLPSGIDPRLAVEEAIRR